MSQTQTRRKPRAKEARKAQWKPPALLETPAPPPGFRYRWLRTNIRGEADDRNMIMRSREGYVPVRPDELPEGFEAPTLEHGKFAGVVGVGSCILAKIAEEKAEAREEYFADQNRRTMEGIENDLMKEQNPMMPITSSFRSRVEFRRTREVDFDEDND